MWIVEPDRVLRTWMVVVSLLAGHVTSSGQSRLRYTVLENQPAAAFVGDLLRDGNLTGGGPPPTFQIRGRQQGPFAVDRRTGVIRTGEVLDREGTCPPGTEDSGGAGPAADVEPACLFSFDVSVSSAAASSSSRGVIGVDVEILDLNDNAPAFPDSQVTAA